jgi:GNAT superfamily N-acetyltransferase
MTSPDRLHPAAFKPELLLRRCDPPRPDLNRELYLAIGKSCIWWERLSWNPQKWASHVADPRVQTWVASIDGQQCGFVETFTHRRNATEITLFGLLSAYQGKGYGSHLLTEVTRTIWQAGASRVWLATSTMDSPSALPNYEARGFKKFAQHRAMKTLPDAVAVRAKRHLNTLAAAT